MPRRPKHSPLRQLPLYQNGPSVSALFATPYPSCKATMNKRSVFSDTSLSLSNYTGGVSPAWGSSSAMTGPSGTVFCDSP